jgi:hypothetical protein
MLNFMFHPAANPESAEFINRDLRSNKSAFDSNSRNK